MNEDFTRTAGGAVVMDGARSSDEMIVELRKAVEAAGTPPVCMGTVVVADDRVNLGYVRIKHRRAEEAAMTYRSVELPPTSSQGQVEASVADLSADPDVHGVFVQLPLPEGLDPEPVLDLVPPDKDIDGMAAV